MLQAATILQKVVRGHQVRRLLEQGYNMLSHQANASKGTAAQSKTEASSPGASSHSTERKASPVRKKQSRITAASVHMSQERRAELRSKVRAHVLRPCASLCASHARMHLSLPIPASERYSGTHVGNSAPTLQVTKTARAKDARSADPESMRVKLDAARAARHQNHAGLVGALAAADTEEKRALQLLQNIKAHAALPSQGRLDVAFYPRPPKGSHREVRLRICAALPATASNIASSELPPGQAQLIGT